MKLLDCLTLVIHTGSQQKLVISFLGHTHIIKGRCSGIYYTPAAGPSRSLKIFTPKYLPIIMTVA